MPEEAGKKKVLEREGVERLMQLVKQGDVAAGTPDGVTLSKNERNELYLLDGSVTVAKLAPEVWAKVEEVMDSGFGEVLNGSY